MIKSRMQGCLLSALVFLLAPAARPGDDIPKAAWKRSLGAPLENPGTKKPALPIIDDGYWQGAPVGGFGAGTFSRTYRGDFARWHLQGGVHKYRIHHRQSVRDVSKIRRRPGRYRPGFDQRSPQRCGAKFMEMGLSRRRGRLCRLYPKAWFDYRWEKFPAHVYVEQFSPILPDNYKETSYPIAVYRWHAENPTKHRVTVSVLLSWENMLGWLRSTAHDFSGAINAGNFNRSANESLGADGAMKGIVFDRNHIGEVKEAWDGQLAIAALESPGVEVSYQTTFDPNGDGSDVWTPFSKDGRLSNSVDHWTSSDEPLAGAIAVRFTLEPGEKRVIPMVISWDLPVVEFGAGRKWHKRYTDFYGASGIERLGHRPRRLEKCRQVERRHRRLASPLRER